MKIAIALSLLASASAFTTPMQTMPSSALRMSEPSTAEEVAEPVVVAAPVAAAAPTMSTALPFMARPVALDGSLAGDVGFDPIGFAKSSADLMNYREAEVKHARLAMLAAAGWPLSEVFDKKIAAAFGATPILDSSDRVPSLLNGGLGKISPAYWIACIGAAAAIDVLGNMKSKGADHLPGDFGLRLGYPSDSAGQQRMQLAEIKNGRLAMIAVFGFAIQEFVSKQGVVDEVRVGCTRHCHFYLYLAHISIFQTPLFFFPIVETMHKLQNSGYIQ